MISFNFFPSRRLAWYLARSFLKSSFAVLVGLVGILMMLDLLGESGEILAQPGNSEAELWRYAGLRIPQIIQRFLPFALLLGTLITMASMNQHSEVIAMKAAGVSAHQIIAPLIVTSLVIAVANFRLQRADRHARHRGPQRLVGRQIRQHPPAERHPDQRLAARRRRPYLRPEGGGHRPRHPAAGGHDL
jgi:hypothetical protein